MTGIPQHTLRLLTLLAFLFLAPLAAAAAPRATSPICQRPAAGSEVPEPEDLRSQDGTLRVELTFRNFMESDGEVGYCYIYKNGAEAPTLHLKPGDWLILSLKNELSNLHATNSAAATSSIPAMALSMSSATASCGGGTLMSPTATNLHFHGLTVPSACHEDDVMQTAVDPNGTLEYKFQIPPDEPPGLYWYHPHIHGFSKVEVLGGASGAIVIEGLERAEHDTAGLPERILIVRDQDLLKPDATPLDNGPKAPPLSSTPTGKSSTPAPATENLLRTYPSISSRSLFPNTNQP